MVLLIIIQLSLLNGYFIVNIPYFQTNPYLSIYLSIYYVCHWKWMKWMDHFHWKCFTRCPTPTERWPSPEPIGSDLKDIEHWNHWTFIWKISGCWSDSFILFILYNTVYIYIYVPSLHREEFSLQFPELWHLLAQLADKTIQHNAKHRFLIPEVRKLNSQKQPSMDIYGLAPWSPHFLLWTLTPRAPRWSMIIFKLILISFFGIIESDKVIELSDEQLIW